MRAIPYIAKLRRLNITAIQSGKPTDRRLFLQEVYVCSRRRNTRGITRYLEISTGNKVQDTVSCIKTLLPKVSSDDRRLVWKHGEALSYAAIKNIHSKNLSSFLRKNGGYNGCVAKNQSWKRRNGG